MSNLEQSMCLTGKPPMALSTTQKLATAAGWSGVFILILSIINVDFPSYALYIALGLIVGGVVVFSNDQYLGRTKGVKNDGIWYKSITSRGSIAWGVAILLTLFYIVLYWFPELLGYRPDGMNTGLIAFFDPLSIWINGSPASQWFVYGVLYTLAILAFGYKFILKYRGNTYEQLRTVSVMFFQLGFAFLIPELLIRLNQPYYNPISIWPLNYDLFAEYKIGDYLSSGTVGLIILGLGISSILIITPILTYFYGKRWYCSWVCGCGGLAETAGDPYRHLSSKKLWVWNLERWMIHSVLVLVVLMTIAVVSSYLDQGDYWLSRNVFLLGSGIFLTVLFFLIMKFRKKELAKDAKYGAIGYFVIVLVIIGMYFFGADGYGYLYREWYGFLIGAAFSGVIGVGFYPILGNRVWCRFGCPMAAILGLQQRLFSRFRITTNGGQCISCGNCSTYCEMGIDVRAYAERGQNIVRASCVGCGICSAVCPRGVLKLENGPVEGRINADAVLQGNDLDLLDLIKEQKRDQRKE